MLTTQVFTLGQLHTNCYLVSNEVTSECILIDPADDGDFLSEKIIEQQLKLKAIYLTHGHFDHVLGLLSVVTNFNTPAYLHPKDQFLLEKAASSAQHWLGHPVDPVPTHATPYKNEVSLLGETMRIIHTPGHTPGSVCIYAEQSNLLFSGDTLFHQAVGRTDTSYGNSHKLYTSIKAILDLPRHTIVLPGHGEPTTIENFKKWWLQP
ncbi:MAG: MBL fold metallo-hydrolase [Pseudomonadales bacterium]|nr:MBL fold metallo-hydrolase [Pseudomonadales bacterium]